jgi:hypothetical protein
MASASPAEHQARKKASPASAGAAAPAAAASPSPSSGFKLGSLFKPKATPTPAAPAAESSSTQVKATAAPGGGHGMVWVNTDSHIYHKEGSRYYGKTKQGKYMTEAEAIKEGDRPAKKE